MADAEGTRWGIAGPGAIATRFADGMRSVAGGTVVAVGSRSAERAEAFAQRFDIARSYGSYEELAADDAVDAVYVATPPSRHAADALLFLGAGKHVLCEKPFTLNATQTSEVVRAAREQDRFVMEAMWSRFLPAYVTLRDPPRRGQDRRATPRRGRFRLAQPRRSHRPALRPRTGRRCAARPRRLHGAAVHASCSARRTRSSHKGTSAAPASTKYRRPCCITRTAGSGSSSRRSARR